jgi:hypothetical protein
MDIEEKTVLKIRKALSIKRWNLLNLNTANRCKEKSSSYFSLHSGKFVSWDNVLTSKINPALLILHSVANCIVLCYSANAGKWRFVNLELSKDKILVYQKFARHQVLCLKLQSLRVFLINNKESTFSRKLYVPVSAK